MSSTTLERTITIADRTDTPPLTLTYIEGQSLEQYFNDSPSLQAPVAGEIAIIDGLPASLDKPVEPDASVSVVMYADRG